MTSKHRHGNSVYTTTGDVDTQLTDLTTRVQALEDAAKPVPPVVVPPIVTPPANDIVVSSIPSLLNALADDKVTSIVMRNGRYAAQAAGAQGPNSLWIGSRFAGRTKPVVVKAETPGGVIFDGGGGMFSGITFVDGAHDQDWQGFSFDNGHPTESGVIVFGGYGLKPAHHITLRKTTILGGIFATTAQNDHCLYFSKDGCHDLLIEDYLATPKPGAIRSALQWYHSPNVYNVVVRRFKGVGVQQGILCYDGTAHDVLLEDGQLEDCTIAALNMSTCGPNFKINRVTSVRSGGTYFPNGQPAGLSMTGCAWG